MSEWKVAGKNVTYSIEVVKADSLALMVQYGDQIIWTRISSISKARVSMLAIHLVLDDTLKSFGSW